MEYDDLQKVKFDKKKQDDIDQDNILMKYFGSELTKTSETSEEDFTTEPQQVGSFNFFIKTSISSLIIVLLTAGLHTETFDRLLKFTSNNLIRKVTIYVLLFISVLTILLVGNSI